ncbi:MAG: hypothetical protein QOE24_2685 [Frankiales bacterium]|nr:hypothetical protein [Frankiales bacterium]
MNGVEDELTAAHRRYRARFEQTAMPQMILDITGRVLDANDAMCRLVGVQRPLLIGRTTAQLHHPSDRASGLSLARDLIEGRVESAVWERVFAAGDGAPVPLLVHSSLVRDAAGAPDSIHAFFQDLTQLRTAERSLTRSTARFEAMLSEATDWAFVADADGRIVYASPAVLAALGYHPPMLVGRLALEFVHTDDRPAMRETWLRLLEKPQERHRITFRARTAGGDWVWVENVMTNRLDHPEIAGVIGNGRDVTERMAAEQAIRASELRYRAIAETAQEGIWVCEITGRTLFANQKAADILGMSVPQLYDRNAAAILSPDDPGRYVDRMASRARTGAEIFELDYLHPDGVPRRLRLSVSPMVEEGLPASLAMISDVTEVRAAEAQLISRALHDELTGLPNRALMSEQIEQALTRQLAAGRGAVAVLLADLDDFKLVNDTWGHAAGDELLQQVGARLAGAVRGADMVARFGGDEFVILCEGVTLAQAEAVASRVVEALADPFSVGGQLAYVAASIGIALSPPQDAATLLQYADTAMYDAKSRGRGQLRVFDVALATNAAEHLLLGNDLRGALADGGLQLHYQPIVVLESGHVAGVEALARWQHPSRGSVPPTVFVEIAERLGLAPVLDRWAIIQATTDAVRLREGLSPELRVSVNISAANLADATLEQHLASVYGDSTGQNLGLTLEITENALMQNPEAARETLTRLHARGVQAAIDDFGTGYSSLAYLSRLPVQAVKIDRSFIATLGTDPHAVAITAAIIDLARTLGLRTVAEGVETPEQLALLRNLGCWAAQGWLWCPALPVEELIDMMSRLPGQRFPVSYDAVATA